MTTKSASPESVFSLHGQMCTRANSLNLSQERVDGIKHGADPEFWSAYDRLMRGEYDGTMTVIADERFEQVGEFSVVVPEGYDHATHLAKFSYAHRKEFNYYSDTITDKNYSKATTKLVAGRKFKVKVFQIKETVTSTDCLGFLKNQKAVLVGAHGASLAYEQRKNQLPVNRWSVSFDEKKALWQDADGHHRVPCVCRSSYVDFKFYLGFFENDWHDSYCLLCFCDK
ncbi:MAG: hypothetical protein AAB484_00810 [Patescibacteria group bacterium]